MSIVFFTPVLKKIEKNFLFNTVKRGWISSQGSLVKKFEKNFAKWQKSKFAVSTSNCTTAIHLALLALNIKKDDEVICTNLTFIAPVNMIKLIGAKPVLVDICLKTFAMDTNEIIKKITNRTKAIMVVHPFGHPANIIEIKKIAKIYKLKIIEDNAESIGAKINKKLLGSFGNITCYSFFANKILTTGEGGMIVTNNYKIYKKLCLLRDHGMTMEKKYYHKCLAFNYRMTSLQAAIGIGQLMRINEILKEKRQIKRIYEKYLMQNGYKIFSSNGIYESVNWFVTLTFEKQGLRDNFISYMKENKVECRQMVFPVTFAKHFEYKNSKIDFKNSYKVSLNSVHLPSSNDLKRKKIINICKIINAWSKL
jgi:perosamine synthetase